MRLPSRILRSTAFRFSIYFASLFALIALAAGWGIFAWVSDEFRERQASYISDMKDTLLTVARNEGFNGLRDVVVRKARVSPEAGIIYLLTDKSGGFIAGNIDEIPVFDGARFIAWRDLHLRNAWSEKPRHDVIYAAHDTFGYDRLADVSRRWQLADRRRRWGHHRSAARLVQWNRIRHGIYRSDRGGHWLAPRLARAAPNRRNIGGTRCRRQRAAAFACRAHTLG